MRYMGGKHKLSKYLAKHLQASIDRTGVYYEPFVGGNNVFWRLEAPEAHLSDADGSLITLYQAYLEGWQPPPSVSREEYQRVREADDPNDPLTAFVAYGVSWGGKRWGGYATQSPGRNPIIQETINSLAQTVRPANYACRSYLDVRPDHGTIYCDPPYRGTTKYTFNIDQEEFFAWCEARARAGCEVFVSEHSAPAHWDRVMVRHYKNQIQADRAKPEEKLYRVRLREEVV